jgi:hypothetical protein
MEEVVTHNSVSSTSVSYTGHYITIFYRIRPVPRQPGRYAPHVVIVIVVILAVIGPAGQVEAALFALAAVLPLLGPRGALR